MVTERDADIGLTTIPFPIVLSAPSGAGKTTVAKEIFRRLPYIRFAVSLTTRKRRGVETEGLDYRFVSDEEFERARDSDELAEWAVVHGHLYGTPRSEIERSLEEGYHVLLDVDVQGGEALMKAYPQAVSIFLLPPSYAAMAARLEGRGTDTPEAIESRLAEAIREIDQVENYEYVIVNRELERTVEMFTRIVHAEEHRRRRKVNLGEWLDVHFSPRRRVVAAAAGARAPSSEEVDRT